MPPLAPLSPLALAILDLILKATALLALAWLAALLLRRASAALRHALWTAAFLGLLLLPVTAIFGPAWKILPAWTSASPSVAAPAAPPALQPPQISPSAAPSTGEPATTAIGDSVPDTSRAASRGPGAKAVAAPLRANAPARRPWNFAQLALALWIAGAALCVARLALAAWSLRRLACHTTPAADDAWRRLLADCHAPRVALGFSCRCTMPLTFGLFSPRILLPESARDWPAEKRRLVLLHELAHIARRDVAAQFLACLAQAFYWFHPLVWMAGRRMALERELACDDRLLVSGAPVDRYAQLLVDITSAITGGHPVAITGLAMAQPSVLEARVHHILAGRRRRGALSRAGTAALLLAGILLTAAMGTLRAQSGPSLPGPDALAGENPAAALIAGVPESRADDPLPTREFSSGGKVQILAVQGSDGIAWNARGGPAITFGNFLTKPRPTVLVIKFK